MKKKVSISTTVTLLLLTMALTISLTMLLAMRHFNNQLQLVSKRQAMYSHINDVDKVVREYYPNLDEELLRQSIAQGYVYGLDDPYAAYYTPDRHAAERLRLSGMARNVGVVLSERKDATSGQTSVVVSRVYDGSSAQSMGVKAGDILMALDNVSVEGKSLYELQSQINAADEISLTVRRGEGESTYPVVAEEYAVRSVQLTVLDNIGYIKITAFYENTPDQFKEALKTIEKQTSITGVIFDLRNNAGGVSKAVQEMLSQVMPLGAYGTMTDANGKETKLSTKVSKALSLPTVTLINSSTAGEAEFFAGVLQEASLTHVIGQTSVGKAKYQKLFVLEQDYSALKLTVGEYGLMKAGSWEGKGIVPSDEVVLPPEQAEIYQMLSPREDAQVQAAVNKLKETSDLPNVTPEDPKPPIGDPSATDPSESGDTDASATTPSASSSDKAN